MVRIRKERVIFSSNSCIVTGRFKIEKGENYRKKWPERQNTLNLTAEEKKQLREKRKKKKDDYLILPR